MTTLLLWCSTLANCTELHAVRPTAHHTLSLFEQAITIQEQSVSNNHARLDYTLMSATCSESTRVTHVWRALHTLRPFFKNACKHTQGFLQRPLPPHSDPKTVSLGQWKNAGYDGIIYICRPNVKVYSWHQRWCLGYGENETTSTTTNDAAGSPHIHSCEKKTLVAAAVRDTDPRS